MTKLEFIKPKCLTVFCQISIFAENEKIMKFYEEENGKQISFWKLLEITKLTSGLNPTHNFKLLKPHRLKQYEEAIVNFNDEMALNEVEIKPIDIPMLYSEWLNNELKVVEQWLSDKYPNGQKKKPLSFAEQIEIEKYKTFISNELKKSIRLLKTRLKKIRIQSVPKKIQSVPKNREL